MTFEMRRPAAVSNGMMLRFIVFGATGIYLVSAEWLQQRYSPLWMGIGGVFLVLAALIVFNLLRPMRLRMTPDGIYAQAVFGTHHFGWDALKWVDFTRPGKPAVLCYTKPGSDKDGFVFLTPKTTSSIERTDVLRYILEQRPDVPTANPEPFVELWSRQT